MKALQAIALSPLLTLSSSVLALDGNDWNAASPTSRLAEIQRILNSIKSNGCTVKRTPEYFVRQINDFYREPVTRRMKVPEALALIASGVGEDWKC